MIFALTSLSDLVQQSAAHAWLIQRIFLARLPRAVFFERNPDLHGHLCGACRLRASALNVSCPALFSAFARLNYRHAHRATDTLLTPACLLRCGHASRRLM